MKQGAGIRLNRIWIGFFCIWLLLLSGVLDFWLQSPGLKQFIKVSSLLNHRRQEIGEIESRSAALAHVAKELQDNASAQEREVRKVLGFLGEHEVIFEFVP